MISVQNKLVRLDVLIFRAIFRWPYHFLERFFRSMTRTADGPTYVLVAILAVVWSPSEGLTFSLSAIIGFAIQIPAYAWLKKLTRRKRPFRSLPDVRMRVWPPDEFSFPSGHTAGAVLMAVLIGNGFPLVNPYVLLWAIGVGTSRVYLGVHYPSDVLAGAALGYGCARMGLAVAAIGL